MNRNCLFFFLSRSHPEPNSTSWDSSSCLGSPPAAATAASTGDRADFALLPLRTPPASEEEWAARCKDLELSLQKFRDQARSIRELLREKVGAQDGAYLPLRQRVLGSIPSNCSLKMGCSYRSDDEPILPYL